MEKIVKRSDDRDELCELFTSDLASSSLSLLRVPPSVEMRRAPQNVVTVRTSIHCTLKRELIRNMKELRLNGKF